MSLKLIIYFNILIIKLNIPLLLYPIFACLFDFGILCTLLHLQHETKHLLSYGGRFSPASQVVLWAGGGSRRLLPHIWAHTPACWLGLHWGLPAQAHRRWWLGEQRGRRRPLLLRFWWASPLVRWGWAQTRDSLFRNWNMCIRLRAHNKVCALKYISG